jgi:redox-sensitive bicupin YhaK (pirin superfamily)
MMNVYAYEKLGQGHGADWLKSHFHFSFADYHDPKRVHFNQLRVINDDTVKAGFGFGMHPHQDMEIITYVRSGAIAHRDSLGNEGLTKAGDVQVMSAGTGITHSEFSPEGEEDATLFQIWIFPNKKGVKPRWEQGEFPKGFAGNELPLLVSGREQDKGKGALYINSDAAIYGGKLQKGAKLSQPVERGVYAVMSKGKVTINGVPMKQGDGAEITNENRLDIEAQEDSELLLIDAG